MHPNNFPANAISSNTTLVDHSYFVQRHHLSFCLWMLVMDIVGYIFARSDAVPFGWYDWKYQNHYYHWSFHTIGRVEVPS